MTIPKDDARGGSDVTSLPNLLSLSRIAAVPLIVPLFYWPHPIADWLALALFAAAAFTDFLDGRIARARRQFSDFGRLVDPIADKLLVAAVLVMLVAFDRAPAVAAVVIIVRELTVSGLREFLAGRAAALPTTMLAKWKTTVQMVAIALLLVDLDWAQPVGEGLLWLAAALTVVTGYDYVRRGLQTVLSGRPDR